MAGSMSVANTFMDNDMESQATYHDIWQSPMALVTHRGFAQLDLVLCPSEAIWHVKRVRSDRRQALASHHFLLEVVADMGYTDHAGEAKKLSTRQGRPRYDFGALKDADVKTQFGEHFKAAACQKQDQHSSCEELNKAFCESLHTAASQVIPDTNPCPRMPWIQTRTLDLISSRNEARRQEDRPLEVELNKKIRKSLLIDRADWLDAAISTGSWGEIKRFKKLRKVQVGCRRLNNQDGKLVESSEKAETFAEHLEKVQWRVRQMNEL